MVCHLFPCFSNALHSCSSSSAVQGSLPARTVGQYARRERKIELTDGWINGILVAFRTLIVSSPRKCPGNLVPSLAIFRDGFEENGILLGGPTTCVEYEERWDETRDNSLSPFRSFGSRE